MINLALTAETQGASELALLAGPVGRGGGVGVFSGLPDPMKCRFLLTEAWQAYGSAIRQEKSGPDEGSGRGGAPPRALYTSGGGPVQDALYGEPWLQAFLSDQCGVPVVPSGNRGSYSYYTRQGDFLGLHLDIYTCDITLITVLHDDTDPYDQGGGLAVYLGHLGAPLSTVREAPQQATLIKAPPGHSIVILGGLLPHCVLPLGRQGQRVISALCFRAADSNSMTDRDSPVAVAGRFVSAQASIPS